MWVFTKIYIMKQCHQWNLPGLSHLYHSCAYAHSPGPRNWQPRALTAAQRLAESCWGFWCCRMSSVTVRSPSDRPARTARTRPSSSTSWQFTNVTSFRCMGRLSTLGLRFVTPAIEDNLLVKQCKNIITMRHVSWKDDLCLYITDINSTNKMNSIVWWLVINYM